MGIDEASGLAVDAARLLLDNDEMRSSQPREINNVYIMRKGESGLRLGTSEETLLPDTMAYVFNFADSAGYAVICADDRVGCPVLACVENGSLELGVESDNPGINIFLDNAQVFMKRSILKFEQEKDSLLKVAESEKKQTEPKERLRKVMKGSYYLVLSDVYIEPLLKTAWGQHAPYNNECPICEDRKNDDDSHKKVGCWAVAVGQVLAYHKNPKSMGGCTFDYDGMTSTKHAGDLSASYQYQVAKLLREVGSVLEMDYGCGHSGTNAEELIPWLRRKGYDVLASRYNWRAVYRQLELHHPVLMHGKREKHNILYAENGHAWVLDGCKRTKTLYETYRVDLDKGTYEITSSETRYIDYYIHINWGWDGASNGYFVQGCFDTSDSEYFDDPSDGKKNYNYKYEQEIVILAD
ncbi:MAG: C10 family peptidase [Paludibacteraceae bacterium]|nr:C10 family peptidase [Paludibacteraceae bacterium]